MERRSGGFFAILLTVVVLVLLAATAYFVVAARAERSAASGKKLLMIGRYEQALSDLQKAEKYNHYLRRDNIEVTEGIAESYFGLGENESAMHYYSLVVDKKPDDAKAQYNLGVLYLRLKDYDKAEGQVRILNQIGTPEAQNYAEELSDVLQKTMMKGLFKGLFDRISPHLPSLPSYLFDESGDDTPSHDEAPSHQQDAQGEPD